MFRDGPREDAPRVRHDDAAIEGRQRKRALDPGRRGVNPAEPWGSGQQPIECLGAQPTPEQDLDVLDRPVSEAFRG
jgi:hypothetical protein